MTGWTPLAILGWIVIPLVILTIIGLCLPDAS